MPFFVSCEVRSKSRYDSGKHEQKSIQNFNVVGYGEHGFRDLQAVALWEQNLVDELKKVQGNSEAGLEFRVKVISWQRWG